jgi:hypothetical protein
MAVRAHPVNVAEKYAEMSKSHKVIKEADIKLA